MIEKKPTSCLVNLADIPFLTTNLNYGSDDCSLLLALPRARVSYNRRRYFFASKKKSDCEKLDLPFGLRRVDAVRIHTTTCGFFVYGWYD